MGTREKMIAYRHKRGLTVAQMAMKCTCSEFLLEHIESFGWVTHPNIAARIAREYQLGLKDYNELVSKCNYADALPEPVPVAITTKANDYV